MKSDTLRPAVVLAALGALLASCSDTGADGGRAFTITARVLDLPEQIEDGSFRFHVDVESADRDRPVPVRVPKQPAAPLFEDDFETGRKSEWRDVLGNSTVERGKLAAADDRNLIVVEGVHERDVRVSVEAESAVQMGILVRYQDMMLWSLPAAVVGQNFGAPVRPGGLVDRVIRAAGGGKPNACAPIESREDNTP
jgi:hypothetical protein